MDTQNLPEPGIYRLVLKVVGVAIGVGALSFASIMLARSLIDIDALPGIKVTQGPPNFWFLVPMLGLDVGLHTVAYLLLRNGLPGKHWAVKGAIFGALVYFSALLPNTLSLIAFDFNGSFDLPTLTLVEGCISIATDGLAGLISGIMMALLLGVGETPTVRVTRRLVLAMAVGAVTFPLVLLTMGEAGNLARISYMPDIPSHAIAWFYWVFHGVFALTGGLLPLFYALTEKGLSGDWWQKGLKLASIYYVCVWLVIANFMVVWGWSVVSGLIFSITSLVPILLVVLGTAWCTR